MIRLLNSIPRWFKQKSDYSEISSEPDFPQGFGYKTAWLAIPSKSLDEIIKVLHLSQPVKANWQSGLNHIYNDRKDNHVFVTPLIKGWNFVIGFGIGSFSTDKENNKIFLHSLTSLAQKMPNFYYFCTHRVCEYHSWIMIEDGKIKRAFAYGDGEIFYEKGAITSQEKELDVIFDAESDYKFPDEEDVIKIASAWSTNPLDIGENTDTEGVGILGKISNGS